VGELIPLGLGAPLFKPDSIWPDTTVIEVSPDVAAGLGDDPVEAVRKALGALASVPPGAIGAIDVTLTVAGSALVSLATDGPAVRALTVSARRRATNNAEALHACLIADA